MPTSQISNDPDIQLLMTRTFIPACLLILKVPLGSDFLGVGLVNGRLLKKDHNRSKSEKRKAKKEQKQGQKANQQTRKQNKTKKQAN